MSSDSAILAVYLLLCLCVQALYVAEFVSSSYILYGVCPVFIHLPQEVCHLHVSIALCLGYHLLETFLFALVILTLCSHVEYFPVTSVGHRGIVLYLRKVSLLHEHVLNDFSLLAGARIVLH